MRSPSCCATHPATATIGREPSSSARCFNLAEPREELFFRPLAHAARVDDDDVGVAVVRRGLVSSLVQEARHALRVVDVHLAAVRFDEVTSGT